MGVFLPSPSSLVEWSACMRAHGARYCSWLIYQLSLTEVCYIALTLYNMIAFAQLAVTAHVLAFITPGEYIACT